MSFKLAKNNLIFKNYLKKIVIFGLVFGVFLLNANFAEAAQFARPVSTVSAGSWTAVGAPQLWQTVDEVTPNDDTDYAEATVNTTAEFGLSSVPDPGVSTGHIVRWRYKPAGSAVAEYIVVGFYQGATLIRSSGNITGSRGQYNNASFTLTEAEADSITDYSDLRLRINTTNLGASESMRVTWLEFEVSDNAPPSFSISQPDGVDDTVTVGDPYNITYTLSDPEETVTAAFYYDIDNTGLDGTAISGPCATAPEGTDVTCSWDTTGMDAGDYYVYGITSDGVNPQVSAYSPGQITINITIEQEILNKVTDLETKVDTLQAQVDQMPQSVWEYANRSLTSFGTLVADIWSYSGRSLDNISNIAQGVWEYSDRALTSFGTLVADIWSYSGRSLDNVSNITQGVWEYSTRTLTSGTSIAQDIWDATTRKLTSREITVGEYIAGESSSEMPSQYNIELVRKATFDFAGFADAGGSTLTLIDSELSEYPDDYWNNYELIMMSGNNIGQKRVICGFNRAAYTITLCSAFDNPIGSGNKYVLSHERKLVHAIWNWSERTLTSGLNIAGDMWEYTGGRTLTTFGTLVTDVWSYTSRELTSAILGEGGQLATIADLDTLKEDLINEINENQTLIENLNNITAAEVWSYSARGLTEPVDLNNPQQVWDVAKASLTIAGSIGEQVANNLDVQVSTRSTLTAADVWSESIRTLTSNESFNDPDEATIAAAVWSEATRELTNYGNDITAADVWNTLSNTLTLQDSIGKQLAGNVDVAVSTRASQASLDALNNIAAADVWSYANRSITDSDAIWEYALSQIGDAGSVGMLLKDNIDATISSRGTSNLTAADVWNSVTRTLTSNENFNDPDSATIAAAVWSEATRELTNYGNDITAQDVWNILASNLTPEGSIGKQLAVNVDVAVSTRSTLTAADVWGYASRTLTSFGTLVADIWSYSTRSLTTFGTLAADIWNNTTRTLTSALLGGGGQIATVTDLNTLKSDLITEINENQTLIENLNSVTAAEIWSYAARGLTEPVDLNNPQQVWDVAKANLTTVGSIGEQVADNLDAAISTRSTLTAADVWSESTRTLTDYATSNISLAVWSEATRELTNYGNDITAADVWNVLSNTLTLENSIGKQLAEGVDVAVSTRASQASLDALNNIAAADVWSYANRSITDPDVIWEYALTQIGNSGSIGLLLKDNIDATISSRGTSNLTAADVWNSVTRTLTSNANFNDPDSATIAAAVWSEATRELTNYGNDITAQDVWNILASNLTTEGSVGKQLATNVDVVVSTRSTLTAANVWEYANRTLTDFGTLVADIWSYSTRTLTSIGSLAVDIWNDTFAPTRKLTSRQIAENEYLAGVASSSIVDQVANEADQAITKYNVELIRKAAFDFAGVADGGSTTTLVDSELDQPDNYWNNYDLIIMSGQNIGQKRTISGFVKNTNTITLSSAFSYAVASGDKYVISRESKLASAIWNYTSRTLTANTNLGISTPAQVADAIWDEALADHLAEGSTGAALSAASTGGVGGVTGLTIESHTVSEFEQGATGTATIQVKRNGIPVSGVTPTGTYYKPNNTVWLSGQSFTEIGSTGIYTDDFDTTGATLGVYKLAVQASQSTGGSSYSENFETGTIGQDMTGWANTGATYSVQYDQDPGNPTNKVYHKSDYGDFHYAYSTAAGDQADFTYTAKVWMPSLTLGGLNAGSDYVGITFRYSDSSNNYDFYFRRAAGNVRLRKNGATLQETPSGSAWTKDYWYKMKVVVTGGTINAYVCEITGNCDDTTNLQKINYTDNNPLPDGKIGLFTYNSIAFWDDIDVTAAGTSETAYIAKDFAIVSPTSEKVWGTATSGLTTSGSIGKAFADNRFIQFNSNGEVAAGSGTNNYKAKLYIYDLATQPVNATSLPSITLYQPNGTVGAGPTDMTLDATGIYSYQTTLGSGASTGRWEAVVTINTGGASTIKTSGYFEVESSPARVTINSITDNTVPSITANFAIVNEGNVGNEYQYEYCVVDTIENVCGGGDDIAYALSAEFIEAGVEEQFNKTLTVNTPGTYFWKVAVYWSTERSVAVLQFNAVEEEAEPTPSPGGGGVAPPPAEEEPVCSGADFNKDGIVNSVDFSILLYFWKTQPPFRNPCVDINKDNKVDSIDFSILLYQWGKPGTNIAWYNFNRIKNLL